MKKITIFVVMLLVSLSLFAGGAPETKVGKSGEILKHATLRMNFLPQTEFAGSFIAAWKGFYEDEGLDLVINAVGSELSAIQTVSAGTDTFGIGEIHKVANARAEGIPLVQVFQGDTDSYLRYVAKKSSGIRKLEDLKGKKISLWMGGGEFELYAMLKDVGIDMDRDLDAQMQRVGLAPFFEDKVVLCQVTTFNELHQIYDEGYSPDDIIIFAASDYGRALIGNGFYCTEDTIKNRPEVVQAFVNASARGWKWAFENPEETVQLFLKHFPDLTYEHQYRMLKEEYDLYVSPTTAKVGIGYLDPAYIPIVEGVLFANNVIKEPLKEADVFAPQFWENIPKEYKIVDGWGGR